MNIVSIECWSLQGEICFYCWLTLKNCFLNSDLFTNRDIIGSSVQNVAVVRSLKNRVTPDLLQKIALTLYYLDDFAVRMYVPRLSRIVVHKTMQNARWSIKQ